MAPQRECRNRIGVPVPTEHGLGALIVASGLGSSRCSGSAPAAHPIIVGVVSVQREFGGMRNLIIEISAHGFGRKVWVSVCGRSILGVVNPIRFGDPT